MMATRSSAGAGREVSRALKRIFLEVEGVLKGWRRKG